MARIDFCENHGMFTGIITALGRITRVAPKGVSIDHGVALLIECPMGYLDDVGLGDSIALNGACMTVTQLAPSTDSFEVEVSSESLDKTAGLATTGPVNLEKALRAGDRLGGHIVSGHVDGMGQVVSFEPVGDDWKELTVRAPTDLGKFLAYKGSITINGVSLTVNTVADHALGCDFTVRLIPHTLQATTLGTLSPQQSVNLEVDTIARYVERMLSATQTR